jgi:hypothetical protein
LISPDADRLQVVSRAGAILVTGGLFVCLEAAGNMARTNTTPDTRSERRVGTCSIVSHANSEDVKTHLERYLPTPIREEEADAVSVLFTTTWPPFMTQRTPFRTTLISASGSP